MPDSSVPPTPWLCQRSTYLVSRMATSWWFGWLSSFWLMLLCHLQKLSSVLSAWVWIWSSFWKQRNRNTCWPKELNFNGAVTRPRNRWIIDRCARTQTLHIPLCGEAPYTSDFSEDMDWRRRHYGLRRLRAACADAQGSIGESDQCGEGYQSPHSQFPFPLI